MGCKMSQTITGTLELLTNGGGHLRMAEMNYRTRPNDVFVDPNLCRSLRLRGGETIIGTTQVPTAKGKKGRPPTPLLAEVNSINGQSVGDHIEAVPLEELTAIDPHHPIRLETPDGSESMRIIDLLTPIGFGQRGLIVAPPRTGKTILLQQMAHGLAANHPDAYLMVLLIDERPEEVTEMRRTIHGEVVASSNDSDAQNHARIARLMIAKAKRMVEAGQDVVIFLDSLTRLGRAFNTVVRGGGRTMSGGLDSRALIEPKAIFGAARKIENGGSLTIVASALIDTGSRMDQVIFNEFKGTGNMEIMLSREMANLRLWPAIDLEASGTRKEEKLLTPQQYAAANHLRRTLYGKGSARSMELLLESLRRHPNNTAFVASLAK
ncbi:MAG: transcription termination factor Rho [Phycisphaerae bacterium]|nr:transcription termination factor Rho [Phycisphaerae bacterium]